MNKTLFHYCQKHLRFIDRGELKVNASLKQLANHYNIGYIDNGVFYFNEKDKQHLIELVAQQLNGAYLSDPYPEAQTRTQIAKNSRNEKIGALKVSEEFVLLNSLRSLFLNQQVTNNCAVNSLGHFLCASEIKTVQHQQIVLVENLIVMANLQRINIPESLVDALWLYRGDAQAQQQTGTANQFFRRFQKTNQLICFSDFDPAGLQIALTCGAQQWLTLEHADNINIKLSGIEQEWFNQKNAIAYLNNSDQLSNSITALFSTMNNNRKTLKQEHMVAHSLPVALYPLI